MEKVRPLERELASRDDVWGSWAEVAGPRVSVLTLLGLESVRFRGIHRSGSERPGLAVSGMTAFELETVESCRPWASRPLRLVEPPAGMCH